MPSEEDDRLRFPQRTPSWNSPAMRPSSATISFSCWSSLPAGSQILRRIFRQASPFRPLRRGRLHGHRLSRPGRPQRQSCRSTASGRQGWGRPVILAVMGPLASAEDSVRPLGHPHKVLFLALQIDIFGEPSTQCSTAS